MSLGIIIILHAHHWDNDKVFKGYKDTVSGKIEGFLKFPGKIQQPIQKRSQKSNEDVILHSISLRCLSNF